MTPLEAAKDGLVAAVAGYVGTKTMEQVAMKAYQWEREADRQREDEARSGPPFTLAAHILAERVAGISLDDDARAKAGMALHYLAGISWVPLYMWLRRPGHLRPLGAGLATGVSQSLLLDELITPAIGASAPNPDYPLSTHLRDFAAHLAYGLAVAVVVEAGWRLLRRR